MADVGLGAGKPYSFDVSQFFCHKKVDIKAFFIAKMWYYARSVIVFKKGQKMAEVTIEPTNEYDILQNEDDEILIALRARMGGVDHPRALYDGKDKVVFYRNGDQTIFFENVPESFRKPILNVKEVLFVEVRDDAIIREYMVPLQKVAKLPA